MDINTLTSASSTNFLDPTVAARPTGKQTLDVNDFLKLLTVQLQNQDPQKPMEDTQFISQMASFSALEQSRDLSNSFKSFSSENLIGKMVNISDANGKASGEVTAVTVSNGTPQLIVNGLAYDPATVTQITNKPAATTAGSH